MARGKKIKREVENVQPHYHEAEGLARLNVTDMAIDDVVALMRAAGCNVDEGIFEAAIGAGAPVRPDGRLNLLELIGWLLAEQDEV